MNRWKITWRDNTWTSDEMKAAHMLSVAELLGSDQWESVSPLSGPLALGAWLTVLIASGNGGDLAAARDEVYQAPIADIVDSLTDLGTAARPPVAPMPPPAPATVAA